MTQSSRMSGLSLPEDIFFQVINYLDVPDILSLRKTCRGLLTMSKTKGVWLRLLDTLVLEPNLPVPRLAARSIDDLDAAELEHHIKLAIRLRHKWTDPEPVGRQRALPHVLPHRTQSRVISLRFLPGRGNRWLLSIHREVAPQWGTRYNFRCWDISELRPAVVAYRVFRDCTGIALNTDPQNAAILAVGCPHVELFGINLSTSNSPASEFIPLHTFLDHREKLCGFSGDILMTRVSDESAYLMWDYKRPTVKATLVNPENRQNDESHGVIIHPGFVLILRSTTLELYSLAEFLKASDTQDTSDRVVLHPVAFHKWQWRIDSGCIVEQVSLSETELCTPHPIYLLIRFGSWFPWPVNVLHHFTIGTNDTYNMADAVGPNNLPYILLPRNEQTIASPIRLFSATHLVLGSYGTALWIDSHTEDYLEQSDRGQRLASRLLSFVPDEEDSLPASTVASTVYDVHGDDTWVHLALQEEEGRIAVGYSDGRITLYDG